MSYNHKVSVAGLVTNDEGNILLVNSPLRGWEYPGGLIEPGETFPSRRSIGRSGRRQAWRWRSPAL